MHETIIPNQHNSTQPFPPVKLHYPQVELDPFSSTNLVSCCCFYPQSNHLCRPAFTYIMSISQAFHIILGQKWCTPYLSLFDPSNQIFHLRIFKRRNLNRGICHTPIFDLTSCIHTPFWPWIVFDFTSF